MFKVQHNSYFWFGQRAMNVLGNVFATVQTFKTHERRSSHAFPEHSPKMGDRLTQLAVVQLQSSGVYRVFCWICGVAETRWPSSQKHDALPRPSRVSPIPVLPWLHAAESPRSWLGAMHSLRHLLVGLLASFTGIKSFIFPVITQLVLFPFRSYVPGKTQKVTYLITPASISSRR